MSPRISILVKTFEREECLVAFLESVRKLGLSLPIHIADDSREPFGDRIRERFCDLNLDYQELPFDVGLSAGRNHLLDRIQTEYFFLLDDDYMLDERTNLDAAIRMLEEKNLDILGGATYDYKSIRYPWDRTIRNIQAALTGGTLFNYMGNIERDGDNLTIRYITRRVPEYLEADIVPNFFVARTSVVRDRNRWDELLKFDEHTEFFMRAKDNGLRVASTRIFGARHCPVRPKHYMQFTDRGDEPLRYIFEKHGVRHWRGVRDSGFSRVMTLDDGTLTISNEYDRSLRGAYCWFRKEIRPRLARMLRPG
jgi:GT2 family glycosyltransferase